MSHFLSRPQISCVFLILGSSCGIMVSQGHVPLQMRGWVLWAHLVREQGFSQHDTKDLALGVVHGLDMPPRFNEQTQEQKQKRLFFREKKTDRHFPAKKRSPRTTRSLLLPPSIHTLLVCLEGGASPREDARRRCPEPQTRSVCVFLCKIICRLCFRSSFFHCHFFQFSLFHFSFLFPSFNFE